MFFVVSFERAEGALGIPRFETCQGDAVRRMRGEWGAGLEMRFVLAVLSV